MFCIMLQIQVKFPFPCQMDFKMGNGIYPPHFCSAEMLMNCDFLIANLLAINSITNPLRITQEFKT